MRWAMGILIAIGVVVLGVAGVVVYRIGPRNIIGMIRYDQRQEGALRVDDDAPDVALLAPDGRTVVHLKDRMGAKPLILIFGSYT